MNASVRNALLLVLAAGLLFVLVFDRRPGSPACNSQTFEGDRFTVCMFRAADHELSLIWADENGRALRGFDGLAASGHVDSGRLRFAMNAGMFDTSGAPIGLFVANGKQQRALNQQAGTGNFYTQPNGVFAVDAQKAMSILTTEDFARSGLVPHWATQSGPMLVIGGVVNSTFDKDGPSRNIRNGVGLQSPTLAYFVISDGPVSFGKFARFFRDALHCGDALYLDGAVSSLWAPSISRRDTDYPLGPMVVVSDRVRRPVSAGFVSR